MLQSYCCILSFLNSGQHRHLLGPGYLWLQELLGILYNCHHHTFITPDTYPYHWSLIIDSLFWRTFLWVPWEEPWQNSQHLAWCFKHGVSIEKHWIKYLGTIGFNELRKAQTTSAFSRMASPPRASILFLSRYCAHLAQKHLPSLFLCPVKWRVRTEF